MMLQACTQGLAEATPGLQEGAQLQTDSSRRGQSSTAVPAVRKKDRSLTGQQPDVLAWGRMYLN